MGLRCACCVPGTPDPMTFFGRTGCCSRTPENFGYMSGGMKDFLDRTFYPVEGKILSLPYAVFISAGNDGTMALAAIRRIANGYPFKEVQAPIIAAGELTDEHLNGCRGVGAGDGLGA